jgi:hypothetical protein
VTPMTWLITGSKSMRSIHISTKREKWTIYKYAARRIYIHVSNMMRDCAVHYICITSSLHAASYLAGCASVSLGDNE